MTWGNGSHSARFTTSGTSSTSSYSPQLPGHAICARSSKASGVSAATCNN